MVDLLLLLMLMSLLLFAVAVAVASAVAVAGCHSAVLCPAESYNLHATTRQSLGVPQA